MSYSGKLPTFDDICAAEARIAGVAFETPVLTHPAIDAAAGAEIFVKAECLQRTGSFKIRGAMNRLAQIPLDRRSSGVVAFSSGNHAQGIARAARLLDMPALIVMPSDAPEIKAAGVRADHAEIHTYDRETESREDIAAAIAKSRGAVLVPSFEDPDIIAGQGTCGLEFARQVSAMGPPLDHLICCAGGGGLISGIALAMETVSPETKIWTAEPEGHDDWRRSLEAGHPVANAPGTRSICDAILTPRPGDLTFAVGSPLLAGGLAVSDAAVKDAMRFAANTLKLVTEPGGAAALACAVRGLPDQFLRKRVGIIVTGGNVDMTLLNTILSKPS
ncbi:UNVERIFIED_CONTAM: hypothetical protein GTU68_039726 [Idotea baltica]|nr:hypothetical protein [Idotea baltica]